MIPDLFEAVMRGCPDRKEYLVSRKTIFAAAEEAREGRRKKTLTGGPDTSAAMVSALNNHRFNLSTAYREVDRRLPESGKQKGSSTAPGFPSGLRFGNIRRDSRTERLTMALKTMSISKLMDLRQKVEAMLVSKVSEERRSLQSRLSNLERAGSGSVAVRRGALRGKVEPIYRNPANPAETWAGRGLRPRWLTAALKSGKNLEDFSIGPTKKAAKAKK